MWLDITQPHGWLMVISILVEVISIMHMVRPIFSEVQGILLSHGLCHKQVTV